MKPTKEQIKEFWEWCGQKQYTFAPQFNRDGYLGKPYTTELPPIDLNNLFKYAVPIICSSVKLELFSDGEWEAQVCNKDNRVEYKSDNDPALALFWAVEAIKNT